MDQYHRLTYPKGVHSFRYFPYVDSFVTVYLDIIAAEKYSKLLQQKDLTK